ncbi:HAD family phosphatase [bacterium]|nr:HAD family phosphatase [bacterium]
MVTPIRPVEAVVFDMDGIIFDTEPVWLEAETELLDRRGKVFHPSFARRLMGVPGLQAMAMVAEHFDLHEPTDKLVVELNGIFHDLLETKLTLMPGVIDRLDGIARRQLPAGVATSTERSLARQMLGSFGLLERFRFVLTRDDVERGKPHPDIYHEAIRRHGSTASKTLVLEDSLAGMQAGKSAGCIVVGLRHPLTHDAEFPHADLVIDHHGDGRVDDLLDGYAEEI